MPILFFDKNVSLFHPSHSESIEIPDDYIAKVIFDARNLKRLSRDKLSKLSGVNIETIKHIEKNKSNPMDNTIHNLCVALNIYQYYFPKRTFPFKVILSQLQEHFEEQLKEQKPREMYIDDIFPDIKRIYDTFRNMIVLENLRNSNYTLSPTYDHLLK